MTSSSGHHNRFFSSVMDLRAAQQAHFFVAITSQISGVYFLSPTAEKVSVRAPFLPSGRVS